MNKCVKAFELVLIGHPDKVCDLVSKAICDQNKGGRNAIECMWGNNLFIVSGETNKKWNSDELIEFVQNILRDIIGLTSDELSHMTVINNLQFQSEEINKIVGDVGTGDNGIYFGGYHKVYSPVIEKMKDMCSALDLSVLTEMGYRTDGKFIFTVDNKGNILDLTMNIASFEKEKLGFEPKWAELTSFIHSFTGAETTVSINPKGDWHKCFGFADCGLTGRKLACDGTCGLFSHGGGAMFGKDISKADITVPIFLNALAKQLIGKKKVCTLSASSIIGDAILDVYKNGKPFKRVSFVRMKEFVMNGYLTPFGKFEYPDDVVGLE